MLAPAPQGAGPTTALPLLWSFRRCPFAIRARLALAVAGQEVRLREVNLRAKPPELLQVSPQATVPVLELADGRVLLESRAIMEWALQGWDPGDWLLRRQAGPEPAKARRRLAALIAANDGPFKAHLDRLRYGRELDPRKRRRHGQVVFAILRGWNRLLEGPPLLPAELPEADLREAEGGPGPWLLGGRACLADWALLPFVRQARLVDPQGFAAAPGLDALRPWLARYEASDLLARAMASPLAERQPWRTPQWIYHLALAEEWREAQVEGVYRRSTRGRHLEQVGFIHASGADQIEATYQRFYADAAAVRLLCIDPQRLREVGIAVEWQRDPALDELFPHILGPLPTAAVVATEPYRPCRP